MTAHLRFHDAKRDIATFEAEHLEFNRTDTGLMLTAHGQMLSQDSPALAERATGTHACNVELTKDGQTALEGRFEVTFFMLEEKDLVVILS